MCQLEMRRACAHVVSVCVYVCGSNGGLQKGGGCRYRRGTFNLHSDWAWRGGVHPYHAPASKRHYSPPPLPPPAPTAPPAPSLNHRKHKQPGLILALQPELGGEAQNKPAAAQRGVWEEEEEEGGGRRWWGGGGCWVGQHVQHNQDKQKHCMHIKPMSDLTCEKTAGLAGRARGGRTNTFKEPKLAGA